MRILVKDKNSSVSENPKSVTYRPLRRITEYGEYEFLHAWSLIRSSWSPYKLWTR